MSVVCTGAYFIHYRLCHRCACCAHRGVLFAQGRIVYITASATDAPDVHTQLLCTQRSLMQTSAHRGVLHAQRRGASCTQTSIVCTEDLNVHTGRLSPLSPRSSSYSQRRLLHTKGAECTLMHTEGRCLPKCTVSIRQNAQNAAESPPKHETWQFSLKKSKNKKQSQGRNEANHPVGHFSPEIVFCFFVF